MSKARRQLVGFAALSLLGFVPGTAEAATNFDVTAPGMSSYVINGANDPTLTLTRGQTYTFTMLVADHPFWITTAPGAFEAETNAFSQGVTNNGASVRLDTVTFVVPASAPATLFYQCSFHDPMVGALNIVSPPATPVPSIGLTALAALASLLLLAALAILRYRTTTAMRCHDQ